MRETKNLMGELHIAVEMLDKLRPKIWKRIVLSLMITGMVYIQFYALSLAFKITIKEIISTVGLITLFFIWFDYYFDVKTYRKYQDKLISLTEINKQPQSKLCGIFYSVI
ncbi:MAG: hypothetical protein LBB22_05605 [Treponema sp.]|jgi:hypothetical protein|nr:hypothetical protein [Treponema sp.]